jgi:hypothetical protein
MGTYQGLTEHVVMPLTPGVFRDGACAARIERSGMAGAFKEPLPERELLKP